MSLSQPATALGSGEDSEGGGPGIRSTGSAYTVIEVGATYRHCDGPA